MATKTVALDEEVYELLKRQKKGEESFSDAVKRLARPRRPTTPFAGIWSEMSEAERKSIDQVYAARGRLIEGGKTRSGSCGVRT